MMARRVFYREEAHTGEGVGERRVWKEGRELSAGQQALRAGNVIII